VSKREREREREREETNVKHEALFLKDLNIEKLCIHLSDNLFETTEMARTAIPERTKQREPVRDASE